MCIAELSQTRPARLILIGDDAESPKSEGSKGPEGQQTTGIKGIIVIIGIMT